MAGACDSLGDGIVIGANSCNGDAACRYYGDLGTGSVGDNSCNGFNACSTGGSDGSASVGNNSCNGLGACNSIGDIGTGSVGNNSCNGSSACGELGEGGNGSVGDNSCNATDACDLAGSQGGTGIVGSYSCNGDSACQENGDDGNGSVGNYSCNEASACNGNGLDDTGIVGNLSCNQSGAYNASCQGVHEDVGNCMYNDVPTLCSEGSIQVDKVVVGNSSARFNLKIDGVVEAYHVGDGGTTGPVLVDPGTHSAGESAAYPTRLSDYDQRTTCESYNAIVGSHSHTIVPRTRGAAVFSVNAGDVVTCTITNTKLTSTWWHKTR